MSDIVERLRESVRACRAIDRSALLAEAAAEIERSRLTCPYVTGRTTQYCTLTPLTLTDAEREAIENAAEWAGQDGMDREAATLRGLLDRAR